MKARTIRETEYAWEQIEEILAAGKARETFGEDGQITVQVEGIGTALLNILDYDNMWNLAQAPKVRSNTRGYHRMLPMPMYSRPGGSTKA